MNLKIILNAIRRAFSESPTTDEPHLVGVAVINENARLQKPTLGEIKEQIVLLHYGAHDFIEVELEKPDGTEVSKLRIEICDQSRNLTIKAFDDKSQTFVSDNKRMTVNQAFEAVRVFVAEAINPNVNNEII